MKHIRCTSFNFHYSKTLTLSHTVYIPNYLQTKSEMFHKVKPTLSSVTSVLAKTVITSAQPPFEIQICEPITVVIIIIIIIITILIMIIIATYLPRVIYDSNFRSPLVQLQALSNSPRHRHQPTPIIKYVGSFRSPIRMLRDLTSGSMAYN